ncbi:hypothetical protein GCK72_022921 [Caenorhabditis remanei]|uniref:Uncharacterized protein n=2 Tax=Caenorhabditis remanei TaxID=31234 RepID=A0A6A5FVD0_CAERE|nr:hypothetical protein GCK72_022921 [Caenorhabditis remanei]KAF1746465.1 hypothetical protein GCK72_022921 [Caenorhabditis remanei]
MESEPPHPSELSLETGASQLQGVESEQDQVRQHSGISLARTPGASQRPDVAAFSNDEEASGWSIPQTSVSHVAESHQRSILLNGSNRRVQLQRSAIDIVGTSDTSDRRVPSTPNSDHTQHKSVENPSHASTGENNLDDKDCIFRGFVEQSNHEVEWAQGRTHNFDDPNVAGPSHRYQND